MTTPLNIVSNVVKVVTKTTDRLTGDRVDYPLLVCLGVVEAMRRFGYKAQVTYGPAAWIEVMQDQSLIWAGCWGESVHLWVVTEFNELVDLNTSVAHRKRFHSNPDLKPLYSPPLLWSKEIPSFYRYRPEGLAEAEPTEDRDRRWWELMVREIETHCKPELIQEGHLDFPNEPIIGPQRKLLDDTRGTFKHFDRALGVYGIPDAPF